MLRMIPRFAFLGLFACALMTTPANTAEKYIILQSTTSTQNSGLFDHILPVFQIQSGIEVRVVAVGTGQAIRNAGNCDGDVLITHAKAAEVVFVASGGALRRDELMYNDFVIVGPKSDPAAVSGLKNASVALSKIAAAGARRLLRAVTNREPTRPNCGFGGKPVLMSLQHQEHGIAKPDPGWALRSIWHPA